MRDEFTFILMNQIPKKTLGRCVKYKMNKISMPRLSRRLSSAFFMNRICLSSGDMPSQVQGHAHLSLKPTG